MVIDPVQGRIESVDEAVRRLLQNAAARSRFFSRPAAWIRENAGDSPQLLEAYADALALELGAAPSASTRPTWLAERRSADDLLEADPRHANDIQMVLAAVAAGAAVVSAAASVVTAVVAVTNTMSASTPTPQPPPKPVQK
jgi:hypothetical protein